MNARSELRRHSVGLLSLLGIQFILGMLLNLFVTLPKIHPGITGGYVSRAWHSFGWAITSGGGIILLMHVIVAVGLLFGSLSLVVRAIHGADRSWISLSSIGAVGVIVALTNGLAFLGYNNDVSSFIMAVGFMISATAYSMAASYASKSLRTLSSGDTKHSSHFTHKYKPSHS